MSDAQAVCTSSLSLRCLGMITLSLGCAYTWTSPLSLISVPTALRRPAEGSMAGTTWRCYSAKALLLLHMKVIMIKTARNSDAGHLTHWRCLGRGWRVLLWSCYESRHHIDPWRSNLHHLVEANGVSHSSKMWCLLLQLVSRGSVCLTFRVFDTFFNAVHKIISMCILLYALSELVSNDRSLGTHSQS